MTALRIRASISRSGTPSAMLRRSVSCEQALRDHGDMACQTAWLLWPEDQVPTATMRWTLQTETSLCKDPDPAVAGDVEIDWMAVWRPA